MRTFWRGIAHTLFWSYDRGSWPYDVMVLAIVLFVLATPRSWFHDQPSAVKASPECVQILDFASPSAMDFRVDASCLSQSARTVSPTPEQEKQIHDLISRAVANPNGRAFEIRSINPHTDPAGMIQSYDVIAQQQ